MITVIKRVEKNFNLFFQYSFPPNDTCYASHKNCSHANPKLYLVMIVIFPECALRIHNSYSADELILQLMVDTGEFLSSRALSGIGSSCKYYIIEPLCTFILD